MVARGFTPLEPYPGGAHDKWLTEHSCGSQVRISYHHATSNITPWCVHCMELGGYRPGRRGWFYAVTDGQVLKAGITNKPTRRLRTHATAGLTRVLHLTGFDDGSTPVAMEASWRGFIRSVPGYQVTREVLPDGYTEAVMWHAEAETFLLQMCQDAQASRLSTDQGRCRHQQQEEDTSTSD